MFDNVFLPGQDALMVNKSLLVFLTLKTDPSKIS